MTSPALAKLKTWLFEDAFPFWSTVGLDKANDGFVERFDVDGAVLQDAQRARLVARQIYAFSVAERLGWGGPARETIQHGLRYLMSRMIVDDTIIPVVKPAADSPVAFDLYDQAFVLFGLAAAAGVGEQTRELSVLAVRIRDRMIAGWKHPVAGFEEAMPRTLPLKANPHMHTLEAALAWADVSDTDGKWAALADEIVELCLSRLIDSRTGALREFFDGDWRLIDADAQDVVEPGHQSEWAWLLIRWGRARGRPDAIIAARRLIEIAETAGVSDQNLTINELDGDLKVRQSRHRLWPQTERIKAAVALSWLASSPDEASSSRQAVEVAATGLIRFLTAPPFPGSWWEHLEADGSPAREPIRASSLYHITCAVLEMSHAEPDGNSCKNAANDERTHSDIVPQPSAAPMTRRSNKAELTKPSIVQDETVDVVVSLRRRIEQLSARLTTAETALAATQRRQDELASRGRKVKASTPRPLRVLRKRMRQFGLWPATMSEPRPTMGQAVLAQARDRGPAWQRKYFDAATPYEAWLAVNTMTEAARTDLEGALKSETGLPRISILTPVYDTPPAYLTAMVESVLRQIYDNWELCLADDASPSPETRALLIELAARDPRIKLTLREENGGISECTNSAAELATGDVIVFVDHDDLITPDCLAEIALYYARNPQADLVYSDDDKVDTGVRRYAPQFKPDWSPTLLLSYMYMSHALSVRRSLYEDLGGFRRDFDGSQDYDFALRAVEKARHVGHIPKILYHWRATPTSTASSGAAKAGSFEAGRRAVQEAIDRRCLSARVEHPQWAMDANVGMFALRFPDEGPSVTIVIPTFNQAGLLGQCIESLSQTAYRNYDVLIVDNGSDEPEALKLLEALNERTNHRVARIPKKNGVFNFAGLMNEAVAQASGELVLLLNNDTKVIDPAWLGQMVGYMSMDGVGSVGARLYFEDGTIQHAGIVHGLNDGLVGHAFRHARPHDWGYMGFIRTAREYSAVTAACLLTPKALFLEMGGFDEANFAVAYNDVDYGFRLVERGLRNIYCADAQLLHLEGKSRGFHDNPREAANLRRLYGDWRDPWFNPNLSLDSERFEPAARRAPMRAARPVRVAAISHNLNAEGAPNTLLDLLLGLHAAGVVDPIILSPRDGPLRAVYEDHEIEVRLFTAPLHDAGAFEEGVDRLQMMIEATGAEVVVANTLHMFFGVTAATRAGLASIWCQHESEPWETYFDFLAPDVRSNAYAAFAQAYRVTYVADATRRAWAGVQTRHTAQTIRHGVPPWRQAEEIERFSRAEARRLLGVTDDEALILVAGTVCRRKGQLDLVHALQHMSRAASLRPVRVFIAGALAERDYAHLLEAEIAKMPPEVGARITIAGPVDDLSLYYAAADVVACTSRVESAPRILVEAMAFGRAIVTTPVFGIPELVQPDVNALFYQPGDVAGLADALMRLVNDDTLRAAFAAAGPEVLASRPGYAEMLEQYEAIIREAAMLRRATN